MEITDKFLTPRIRGVEFSNHWIIEPCPVVVVPT